MDRTIDLADGRRLMVRDEGDPAGPVILSFHGSGMGRTLYGPHREDVIAHGRRAIAYDRPGLGGSTRKPGYAIADCVADVRAIAAALEIERLAVWGASAGGPFALACGALAPDLVSAVALFAPAVRDLDEAWADPEAKRAEYAQLAAEDRVRSIESWMERLSPGLPPADLRVLETGDVEWYAEDAREAMSQGGDGWFDEGWARDHDWGFSPEDVTVPVLVLHGRRDTWVEPRGSEELARRVPHTELRLTPEDGHLSILRLVPEVNEWLVRRLG